MPKRLYRSRKDNVIGGVCGGLGDYLNVDPVILRLAFVLLFLADGAGLIIYIIAWIIIPQRPLEGVPVESGEEQGSLHENKEETERDDRNRGLLPGLILVAIGLYFLFDHFWFWWDIEWVLPLILIGFGIYLMARQNRRDKKNESTVSGGAHESGQV